MDKPLIFVIIASEAGLKKKTDVIMKTRKLLWNILFSNKKSGVSGVFRDLGPLVLLQNENSFALRISVAVQWNTAQKMKFSIKDFFIKCEQIHRKLRIWSHLLKKPLIENFIFCVVEYDSKMFLAFSSSFLGSPCMKVLLGKLWQPGKFLYYSATSTLVSQKLASYKKVCVPYCA